MEELQEKLKALKAEDAKLDETIAEHEKDAKTATDRKGRLQATKDATVEADADTEKAKASIADMQAYLKDFPTETQVLKLERRVESLKDQLKDTQRTLDQLRTGIRVYATRRDACAEARRCLTDDMAEWAQDSLAAVQPEVDAESALAKHVPVAQGIDDLCEVCTDRETELMNLNQSLADGTEEEKKVTDRIAGLQTRESREVPLMEAEAERHLRGITTAWTQEKVGLQAVYDRLYVVNQEQMHHLQRGTHVKRDTAGQPNQEKEHLDTLSHRHAQLTAQLVAANEKLAVVKDENAYAGRSYKTLCQEGKKQSQEYEALVAEVNKRLGEAQDAQGEMTSEGKRLKSLKVRLQKAATQIREQ